LGLKRNGCPGLRVVWNPPQCLCWLMEVRLGTFSHQEDLDKGTLWHHFILDCDGRGLSSGPTTRAMERRIQEDLDSSTDGRDTLLYIFKKAIT